MNAAKVARRFRHLALALGGVFGGGASAFAQDAPGYPASIDAYDAREVAMLPSYCIHTQVFRQRVPGGSNPQAIDRWRSVMGPTFEAMHHYCWGLMKTNRGTLLVRNRERRQFYLADAVAEYDFVLDHAPQDFILLPEILTKKGENLVRLGKGPVALTLFDRAIELKPDYWPPYAQSGDYYKSLNDLRKAREILEQGLVAAPDTVALKRRLAELVTSSQDRKGSAAASELPASAR